MTKRRAWAVAVGLGLGLGPLQAQTFTEVGSEAFPWVIPAPGLSGAAWGDYDNDGWLDVYVAGSGDAAFPGGVNRLFHNDGDGTFTEAMSDSSHGGGVAWADYDNDGNLDLVALTNLTGSKTRLHHGNGDGTFTEASLGAGVISDGYGLAWADYDSDGNVDLHIVRPGRDRLFRNNADGTFTEVGGSTGLDDPGGGNGVAWGDYDDDGDPDPFVANSQASQLYQNLGDGTFSPVDAALMNYQGMAAAWADQDNDGDLDLYVTQVHRLYRNQGDGTFAEVGEREGIAADGIEIGWGDYDNDGDLDLFTSAVVNQLYRNQGDATFVDVAQSAGVAATGNPVSAGDYDNDGDLDLFVGGWVDGQMYSEDAYELYQNEGTDRHWLQVELVGTRSNRSAIGACVLAVAGGARQRRDVDGGSGGWSQPSLPLEFGLGGATRVDSLIVRWPSGQRDVLTAIPADRRIRLIEGQPGVHEVHPTVWTQPPPAALRAGTTVPLAIGVRPALFEAGARITRVAADLSPFGGSSAQPLVDRGDGTFALQTRLAVGDQAGRRTLGVAIEQQTSLGPYLVHLSRSLAVMPAQDLAILDGAGSAVWLPEVRGGALAPASGTFAGRSAAALAVEPASFVGWGITLRPAAPVDPLGYALRFAFHPGTAAGPTRPQLNLRLNSSQVFRLVDGAAVRRVDLGLADWQEVEVPLDSFSRAFQETGQIESVAIEGNLTGTFYLSDLRLATIAPAAVATAVTERTEPSRPSAFALEQNCPNPFNSDTAIRFWLAERAEVELSLYDLAGQRVATLARGWREPGTYTLRWDGRDDRGRPLASGVYLYQLHAGSRETARRLLLLR